MRSQWTVALTMIPVLKRVLIATAFLLLALTTVAFQVSTTCNNRYVVINQRASLKTTFSHSFRSSISNQQIYGAHGMVVSGEEEGKVDDANDIITASIKVSGDVGGYYRACVSNEAGKFRRLVGTMSMPDGSSEAEIYVEGKRNMVEGFVRWCKRSKVGLSQKVEVDEVVETRMTGFIIHALIAGTVLLLPTLRFLPIPVVSGVFLFLGRKLMTGNTFLRRIVDAFAEKKRLPKDHPINVLGRKKMNIFTIIQLGCLATLWAFKQNSATAIFFPSVIGMLMILRSFILPLFFSEKELIALGDPDPT